MRNEPPKIVLDVDLHTFNDFTFVHDFTIYDFTNKNWCSFERYLLKPNETKQLAKKADCVQHQFS